MRHLVLAVLVSGLSLSTWAEDGSGHVIEQVRNVGNFHAMTSEGAYVLDVTVGPAVSVKLKGDDDLVADIETAVTDGKLVIRPLSHTRHYNINDNHTVHVNITVPSLDTFTGEGAGKTVFHGLSGEHFTLNYNGAGLLTATGEVKNLTVQAGGAGSLDFRGLKATNATISLDGVGAVNVYARDTLTAAVNGIGTLNYYGHPAHLNKSVSGIGTISAGD